MLSSFDFLGPKRINANGRFFLYYSASNPTGLDERIRLFADGKELGLLAPGDFVEELPSEVNEWYIEPLSALVPGRVAIGDGKLRSNRLTGNVRVIDDGIARTLTGLGAFGASGRVADATRFGIAGLFANGAAVAVNRLQLSASATGRVIVFSGTAEPTLVPSFTSGNGKIIGTTVAAIRRSTGLAVAATPTVGEAPGYVGMFGVNVTANAQTEVPLKNPLYIPAGAYLGVVGPAINTEVTMFFDAEVVA